jgi:hypothetical protein
MGVRTAVGEDACAWMRVVVRGERIGGMLVRTRVPSVGGRVAARDVGVAGKGSSERGERPSEVGERPSELGERPSELGERPSEVGERSIEGGERPSEGAELGAPGEVGGLCPVVGRAPREVCRGE